MPLDLTTGVPGAGKTLFTVAEVLRPMVGQSILYKGKEVPRRLMIGGIPDLLLPHDLVEMPVLDPETWVDEWGGIDRKPGEPAVTHARREGGKLVKVEGEPRAGDLVVPVSGDNWWLWCTPGDVIVLDECQRLFRPMSAGKKVPQFVAKLETHRHYGVDFVLITQHPNLLHANVRRLIGRHRHVRRLFGRGSTVVYEWDQCTDPGRITTATKRMWAHKKDAFQLYKSAEVHTKQKHTLGAAMWVLMGALVATPVLIWWIYHRNAERSEVQAAKLATAASASSPAASQATGGAAPRAGTPGAGSLAVWPVLNGSAAPAVREPYHDRGLHLEGCFSGGGDLKCFFAVTVKGQRMRPVSSGELAAAGYSVRYVAPCAVVLVFKDLERPVTCDAPPPGAKPAEAVAMPQQAPASAPA